MRRRLRVTVWVTAAVVAAGCALTKPVPEGTPVTRDVDVTEEIVAGIWVGHVSGAVYTFAAGGTFTAVGVPTATFEEGDPFATSGPTGPYHCEGSWHISGSRHTVVLDFESIRDERDAQPFGGPRSVTFAALTKTEQPQWPVVLQQGTDWLTER